MDNKRKFRDVIMSEINHIIEHGGAEDFVRLLDEGINVDTIAPEEISGKIIHIASKIGRCDIIEILLKRGIEVNETDDKGWAPLHYAAAEGRLEALQALIRNGANIDAGTRDDKLKYFHLAAGYGHKNVLEMFLKQGGNPNEPDNKGCTLLHHAAVESKVDIVRYLIENKANNNTKAMDGETPLHLASHQGNISVVEYLLTCAPLINDKCEIGWTPLHYATSEGCIEVVKMLLNNNASMNEECQHGQKPIHLAAENGYKQLVEIFLNKGCNVNNLNRKNHWTCLHYAAAEGLFQMVQFLCEKGADINIETTRKQKAIHMAALFGHNVIIECFLRVGMNIDEYNSKKWTILHFATKGGKLETIKYLVENNANIHAKNSDGNGVLHLAAERGEKDAFGYFLNLGIDFKEQNNIGWTPLHYAAMNGSVDIVKLIVKRGAEYDESFELVEKLLHIAAYYGQVRIVEFFMKIGQCPNSFGKHNNTLLHETAGRGDPSVLKVLIENGADPHLRNSCGEKPIHIAAKEGNKNVIEFFLNMGFCINDKVKDSDRTLLHLAVENNDSELVQYLLKSGANIKSRRLDGRDAISLVASNRCLGYNKHDIGDYETIQEKTNNIEIILDLLIKEGGEINNIDERGWTPLHYASKDSLNFYVIDKLVEAGAKLDIQNIDSDTPLHIAVIRANSYIVHKILEARPDLNIKNSCGHSPLHLAILSNNTVTTIQLLEAGAKSDIKDNIGRTAAFYYIDGLINKFYSGGLSGKDISEAERILSKITSFTDIDDLDNKSAAHLLAQDLIDFELFELVLNHQSDLNVTDGYGRTPLNYITDDLSLFSQIDICVDIIKDLIERGAYFNAEDCQRIVENRIVRDILFTDIELCSQSIINKFNLVDLPFLYDLPLDLYLPPIERMRLNYLKKKVIEKCIETEIKRNSFCDASAMITPLLYISSVASLVQYYRLSLGHKK